MAALVLTLAAPLPAPAEVGFGRITLKSGQVVEGDVARDLGENLVVRTPSGLRVLPKASVEKAEKGSEVKEAARPSAKAARKSAGSKSEEARADKVAAGPSAPGAGEGEESAGPRPGEKRFQKPLPDPRLEAARSGGAPPVLEIAITGTVDGKAIAPGDPFAMSRLTFFFTETSRPRFEVLSPAELRSPGKKAAVSPRPEYRAELKVLSEMKDITFYGTSVLKTFRSRASLNLVRLSDKKVVDGLELVEDEGGDPVQRAELCQKAYQRSVESLVKEMKGLPALGGSPQVEDKDGNARANSRK